MLVNYVKTNTKRGKDITNVSLSDRAWNDPGPRRGAADEAARRIGLFQCISAYHMFDRALKLTANKTLGHTLTLL